MKYRTIHSRKPIELYEKAEAVSSPPRVEFFARQRRIGWDSVGDQLEKDVQVTL